MNFKDFYISKYLNRPLIEEEFFKEEFDQFKKEYKIKSVFFETPLYAGNYSGGFNDQLLNKMRASNVLQHSNYIKDIIYGNTVFKLYKSEREDLIEDSLIWNDSMLGMYAYYKPLKDGGIELDSSWNHLELEGLFRFYFWNELFPNSSYIQSSYRNTTQSKNFWIKICKEAAEKKVLFSVKSLDSDYEEFYTDYKKLENDADEIWNNYSDYLRLRVYNKS